MGFAQRSKMQRVTRLGAGRSACRHPNLVQVSGAGLLCGQGGRAQSEVTCSKCYIAYQAHLVVGGLCEECRT